MACHNSPQNEEYHCIGWLHNQLGVGNNLGLRLEMKNYSNSHEIEIDGPQFKTFKETIR